MTNLILDDIGVTDDLAIFLGENGLGTVGTDIFSGQEPDSAPDLSLTLECYGGEPPEHVQDMRQPPFDVLRVQVSSRAHSWADASSRCWAAHRLLQLTNQPLNGTFYGWIDPLGYPIRLGVDPNGRHVFTFNLQVKRRN